MNPDECQHPVQTVERVYESTCPGSGGTPVSKMGQCGGKDYSGPTCCYGYSVCVQKSEFFSLCEGANVPSGLVPWHAPCEAAITCEPGSTCEESDAGSFCKPALHHIPHSGASSSSSTSRGATIGIGLGFLTLLAIAVVGAFGAQLAPARVSPCLCYVYVKRCEVVSAFHRVMVLICLRFCLHGH